MPWDERRIVDERMRMISCWQEGEQSIVELARRFGVSRKTCYKWLDRYRSEGPSGLADRQRVAVSHPATIAPELIGRVLELRLERATWGPRKLHAWLERREPERQWPAPSTIGKYLRRHGVSARRRSRARRTPPYGSPFVGVDGPNRTWCADYKGWFRTGDGRRCEPLTITDAWSRFALACEGLERPGGEASRQVFQRVFRQRGLPCAIRTDNGPPFASRGLGGLSRLSVWWVRLGIVPERIEPGHPEQNGRHERFHRTLGQHTASPPAPTLRAQQELFERFVLEYNFERPHEALGQRTPAMCYAASERSYPERLAELQYARGVVVRRVRSNGEIKWRGRKVFLSESLIGEAVGLRQCAERYWLVTLGTFPLGWLDEHLCEVLRLDCKRAAKQIEKPTEGSSQTATLRETLSSLAQQMCHPWT